MLYKRGNVWWTRFEHGGVRFSISTHRGDRREAEKEARRLRVEVEERTEAGKPGRPCGVTLETLEALDLARVADEGYGKIRAKTVEGLWKPLHRLMGAKRDATRLTVGDVAAYAGARRREGVRGQTIKREVEALVRALRIAKRDKLTRALPFDPDDLPRIRFDAPNQQQRGKTWRPDQIAEVFAHLSKKALTAGHLDRCRLIMLTGLRLEELHRLQPSWVVHDISGDPPAWLHIPPEGAKWGKPRPIPLVPAALEIIERCAPFKPVRFNKSLAHASRKAGLSAVMTPRDLRTTFLDEAGRLDPVAAQKLGGHSNIATTGLYLRGSDERTVAATKSAANRLRVVTVGVMTAENYAAKKSRKAKQ